MSDNKRKTGRPKGSVDYKPSDYIEEILQWISEGKTLREYCRQDGKPSFQLVYLWLNADESFLVRYEKCRLLGADQILAEALEIADNGVNDWMNRNGFYVPNAEHISRSKLRVETRFKLLSKWWPQRYGDKVQLSGDAENPVVVASIDARQLSTGALKEIMAAKDAADRA